MRLIIPNEQFDILFCTVVQLNYKAKSIRFRIRLRNRSPFFSMMERTMPSKSHSHISRASLYKILYISFDSRNSSRSLDVSISLVNLTVRIFYIIGFVRAVSWNHRPTPIVSRLDSVMVVLGTVFYMADPQIRVAAHVHEQDVYIVRCSFGV